MGNPPLPIVQEFIKKFGEFTPPKIKGNKGAGKEKDEETPKNTKKKRDQDLGIDSKRIYAIEMVFGSLKLNWGQADNPPIDIPDDWTESKKDGRPFYTNAKKKITTYDRPPEAVQPFTSKTNKNRCANNEWKPLTGTVPCKCALGLVERAKTALEAATDSTRSTLQQKLEEAQNNYAKNVEAFTCHQCKGTGHKLRWKDRLFEHLREIFTKLDETALGDNLNDQIVNLGRLKGCVPTDAEETAIRHQFTVNTDLDTYMEVPYFWYKILLDNDGKPILSGIHNKLECWETILKLDETIADIQNNIDDVDRVFVELETNKKWKTFLGVVRDVANRMNYSIKSKANTAGLSFDVLSKLTTRASNDNVEGYKLVHWIIDYLRANDKDWSFVPAFKEILAKARRVKVKDVDKSLADFEDSVTILKTTLKCIRDHEETDDPFYLKMNMKEFRQKCLNPDHPEKCNHQCKEGNVGYKKCLRKKCPWWEKSKRIRPRVNGLHPKGKKCTGCKQGKGIVVDNEEGGKQTMLEYVEGRLDDIKDGYGTFTAAGTGTKANVMKFLVGKNVAWEETFKLFYELFEYVEKGEAKLETWKKNAEKKAREEKRAAAQKVINDKKAAKKRAKEEKKAAEEAKKKKVFEKNNKKSKAHKKSLFESLVECPQKCELSDADKKKENCPTCQKKLEKICDMSPATKETPAGEKPPAGEADATVDVEPKLEELTNPVSTKPKLKRRKSAKPKRRKSKKDDEPNAKIQYVLSDYFRENINQMTRDDRKKNPIQLQALLSFSEEKETPLSEEDANRLIQWVDDRCKIECSGSYSCPSKNLYGLTGRCSTHAKKMVK